MAEPELFNFVTKFYNLWHAGKSARLSMECEAGQASLNLQLRLGPHPHHLHHQEPYHGSRKAGPSHLRRSARRAQARATAAEQAAAAAQSPVTYLAAVKAAPSPPVNAAVQAVISTPEKVDAAVQADIQIFPDTDAVQADESSPVAAGQAGRVQEGLPDDQHHPRRVVTDVFCYDSQHQTQALTSDQFIPQLDGSRSTDAIFAIQCENCNQSFKTKDQLADHDEINQFGCDDCGLCYKSQYLADLHELAVHPGTYYALHIIPDSTKLQFAHSCE